MNTALTAAEFVPGVSEVEISVTLGSNVLSQFQEVKSSITTLITGLKSIQDSIEEWSKTPTLPLPSIRNSLVALFAGKILSTAVQSLFKYTKWDQAPAPTQLPTTQTTITSSTSQKVSETPYIILTKINTTKADVSRLLNDVPANISFFEALQMQLVLVNLTGSMATKFSIDPIVSLAFSHEYEHYCHVITD